MKTVTRPALLKRINRTLNHSGERLAITRGDRWRGELGDYYVIDFNRNTIVAQHVDPEELARELGVLRADELVAEQAT